MRALAITLCIVGCINQLPLSSAQILDDHLMQVDYPAPGIPWPHPQEMQISQDMMTLNPIVFNLSTNADECDIVRAALDRYKNLILLNGNEGTSDRSLRRLSSLDVNIDYYRKSYCDYPALGDDESYTITMKYEDQTAYLKSSTVWGALRGLETFSQLVHLDDNTKTYRINVTNIKDKPRFPYRGVLIDTAKHYLPTDLLKLNLDAMAYNKLNVFHWHIVDDESFPLQSLMYPNLTTLGAFSRSLIYTQVQIKEVVAYARLRGIRVVPEFDTPAHTKAMGIAFPHLMTQCPNNQEQRDQYTSKTTLNPTSELTYHVLEEIIRELKTLFSDEYIHLGMNDINEKCWDNNPDFNDFKVSSKLADDGKLESYYASRIISTASDMSLKAMVWQDVVEKGSMDWGIMKKTIVQIRKDTTVNRQMLPWFEYAKQFGIKEYQMVISSCWNLNYPIYGEELQTYYECDPEYFLKKCDKCYKDVVRGGEAILWGDLVDSTNLITRMWPSASAMAERLWSSTMQNKFYEARFRLDQQRCRMRQRGIAAGPVMSGHCGDIDRNSTLYAPSFQSTNFELCSKTCNCVDKCNCSKTVDNVTEKPAAENTSAKPNNNKSGVDFTQKIIISATVNTDHFTSPTLQLAAALVFLLFK